jgi:hypothetical protein
MNLLTLKTLFVVILSGMLASAYAQINVPINSKELSDYNREREVLSFMKIDLSQTWLYMVKDNVISSNKILVQEVYYNKSGVPERIVQYNEKQKPETFTVIKYNSKNLPFEEIKFSADSTLIKGTLFEYSENGYLNKQVDYNNEGGVIAVQNYNRYSDSIVVTVSDATGALIYKSTMDFSGNPDLMKNLVKTDKRNTVFEKVVFEYDELQSLTRKFVYDSNNTGIKRDFVYNNEGALIRTMTYNEAQEIISDSSFEYDEYGNLIQIIDDDKDSMKVYFINYLSKIGNNDK